MNRLLAAVLLGALLLAVISGVVLLDRHLDRSMASLKEAAIGRVETLLGRRIRYGSISPSIFGFLAIRDLQVCSFEDPDNILLQVSRLKVHYRILDLILKSDPARSISEIHVAHSVFTVDLGRDRELLELFQRLTGPATGGGAAPEVRIGGSNITLNLRSSAQQLSLSKLFFTIDTIPEPAADESAPQAYRVAFRTLADLKSVGPAGQPLRVSTRVRISGRVGRDLTWSDLALRMYSLSTDAFTLGQQTFQVSLRNRRLDVHKVQDRAPLDLHLAVDLQARTAELQVKSEDFQPSSMLSFSGPLRRFAAVLNSPMTLAGRIGGSLDGDDLSYDLDVRTRLPEKLLPAAVRLSARLRGDLNVAHFDPLKLDSDRGSLEFVGNVLLRNLHPQGLLQLVEVRTFADENLSAVLRLARQGETVQVSGEKLTLGSLELGKVDLALTPSPRGVRYTLATLLPGDNELESSIRGQGELTLRPSLGLQASCAVEGLSLQAVQGLFLPTDGPLAELGARLDGARLSAEIGVDTNFERFAVDFPLLRLSDRDNPERWLETAGRMDNRGLHLQRYSARWDDYDLDGTLRAEREPGRPMLISTSFSLAGIPYSLEARLQPGQSLLVNGSYGLSGWAVFPRSSQIRPVSRGGTRGLSLSLSLTDLPIPLDGPRTVVLLGTELRGSIAADGRLSLESPLTVVQNLPILSSRRNRLEAAFILDGRRLLLPRVSFTDSVSTLAGSGDLLISSLSGSDGSLQLSDRAGQERYALRLIPRDGELHCALQFQRAPLERFGRFMITGRATGTANLEGPLARPRVTGSLTLVDGRMNDDPVGLSLAFEALSETYRLSDLRLSYRSHFLRDGQGSLDTRSGLFEFLTRYEATFGGRPVSLQARMNGSLAGPGGELPFELRPDRPVIETDLQADLHLTDIMAAEQAYPSWGMHFQAGKGSLAFRGGPEGESIRGGLDRDGNFHLTLMDPLPVQGRATGRVGERKIQSSFSVERVDMRMLAAISRSKVFRFTAGNGRGELQINGALNDPDFFGRLAVRGGAIDFAMSPDPVGPFDGTLLFNGKMFTLQRTLTSAGNARVAAHGSFSIDHWVPNAFELTFSVVDQPGLRMRHRFGPVFAEGLAWGSVQVRGDGSGLEVEGDLQVDQCQIAIEERTPPSSSAQSNPLTVKMDITTGKRVEFFWPSIRFPIVRAFARQGEKVSLLSDEVKDEFTMNGQVEIRGGEIFYFDRSFNLKEGKITFRETGEEFDPRIEALAELRERDADNTEIRIYLEANNRLSQFSPRFYSTPSRPNSEILGLIGGSIAERLEGGSSTFGSAMMLTSDLVSQFYILRPFEQAVRELLGLDMFTVRTQMVQNVLFGRIMGEKSAGDNLNPLDNTTLSLGKYLGTDLFLEMLLRFQSTDAAPGQALSGSRIQTEGEIAFEWQTPFFMLEWTFTPRHPETLFLTDNTLGLSWGFSY